MPELSNEATLGGAVVSIRGDLTDLEKAVNDAKKLAEQVEATKPVMKMRLDLSDADRRVITGGGNGIGSAAEMRIVARLDSSKITAEVKKMIAGLQADAGVLTIGTKLSDAGSGDGSGAGRNAGQIWGDGGPSAGRSRTPGNDTGERASRSYIGDDEPRRGSGRAAQAQVAEQRLVDAQERETRAITQATSDRRRITGPAADNRLDLIADEVSSRRQRLASRDDPGGSSSRASARNGSFQTGMIGRFIAGAAVREGVRAVAGLPEYNRQLIEAGNDQNEVVKAQMARRATLTSGIIGSLVNMIEDPDGSKAARVNLTTKSTDQQENYGRIVAAGQERMLVAKEQAAVATAGGGYRARLVANENSFADAGRKITAEKNAADTAAVAKKETAIELATANRPPDASAADRQKYQAAVKAAEDQLKTEDAQNQANATQQIKYAATDRDVQKRIIVGQQSAHAENMRARLSTADQQIAGHSLEASFTGRISAKLQETETASPEDRAKMKAVDSRELEAMRHDLTGYHGGEIVSGSTDNGATQARVFAARARGAQEKVVSDEITAAERQVAAWTGDPASIAGVNGAATPGAHAAGHATAGHAAAHAATVQRTKYGQMAYAANMRRKAAPHLTEAHAPTHKLVGKDHHDIGYAGIRTELGDAVQGPDGLYHVNSASARGMGGALTPDQYRNMRAAEKAGLADVGTKHPSTKSQRAALANMSPGGTNSIEQWKRTRITSPDSIQQWKLVHPEGAGGKAVANTAHAALSQQPAHSASNSLGGGGGGDKVHALLSTMLQRMTTIADKPGGAWIQ